MEGLTKENTWDEIASKHPVAFADFNKWIDAYKKEVHWDQLFINYGSKATIVKFHDLPFEMQMGILFRYVSERTDEQGEFEGMLIDVKDNMLDTFAEIDSQISLTVIENKLDGMINAGEAEEKYEEKYVSENMFDPIELKAKKGLTTDPTHPGLSRGGDKVPRPQNDVYLVLSDEEKAKGFIRPVRQRYVHSTCGVLTNMGLSIAETYARDPKFYGFTYCVGCQKHLPVGEFTWADTDQVVGS